MRYLSLASFLLAAPLVASAQTTSLNVNNFNFETGGVADGTFSNNPGVIPTGWTAITNNAPSGNFFGYFNPDNSGFAGTSGTPGTIGTMNGPNVFYFGSSTTGQGIQQTLGTNFALNTSYTLTTAIGCRSSNTYQGSVTMEIYAGSTLLVTGTFLNSTANTFSDYSLTYTGDGSTNAGLVGSPLLIRLSEFDQNATVTEADVDNVRLTATSVVPEPSTWAGGVGLLVATAAVWRRRLAAC